MRQPTVISAPPPTPRRLALGRVLLGLAALSVVLVLFVPAPNTAAKSNPAFTNLLLSGVPVVAVLGAIACFGASGFVFLRTRRASKHAGHAANVTFGRYCVGLALLLLPVLFSWLEPVIARRVPGVTAHRVAIGALLDIVVLLAFLTLGSNFADKFYGLFTYDARVVPVGESARPTGPDESVPLGARFYLGAAIFVLAFAIWGLVPLASSAGWGSSQIASLSGGIFIANKLLLIAAAAVMGKPGFDRLKGLLFKALRRFGPPADVSRRRYRLGLYLFVTSLLLTWIEPYAYSLLDTSSPFAVVADVPAFLLLLTSLFVLGGNFWDKLRALFVHSSRMEFAR